MHWQGVIFKYSKLSCRAKRLAINCPLFYEWCWPAYTHMYFYEKYLQLLRYICCRCCKAHNMWCCRGSQSPLTHMAGFVIQNGSNLKFLHRMF